TYRYVNLPPEVNLGDPDENGFYRRATVGEPGLGFPWDDALTSLPATRVIWGATVLKNAPNAANAVQFLQLLLGPTGQSALLAKGPAPFSPARVSRRDFKKLPAQIQGLVKVEKVFDGEERRERDHERD
ncbi:MAG TPA: hypothetical protein VMK12_29200, partial [Anaeromyxobacteraceae bacterium]|nr:hypothetical protein [Anaeromyxobacteraceae bacterium]